jgi:alanine racemase
MCPSEAAGLADPAAARAGAILTIDLDAVADNYRRLCAELGGTACAAVVKADAYGLGMEKVAPALVRGGCETFFVAHIDEGMELRRLLRDADIHVFNGLQPGSEPVFAEHRLVPVLNSLGDIEAWARFRDRAGAPPFPPADIHVDTGMARLGLPPEDVETLGREPDRLGSIDVAYVISHLACADEPGHTLNRQQLDAFRKARAALPGRPASLVNSSGIFLGPDYHFDLARPGAALYGVAPVPGEPNPMAQVVRLQGKILQVRDVDTPQTVGYGATHRIARRGRIATVAVGYADGYLRSLSNSGGANFGDIRVPVVGRVSMDLITLDVSDLPHRMARPGDLVDLIGPHNPVDRLAAEGGTIGYEILTSLGSRYHRVYKGGGV